MRKKYQVSPTICTVVRKCGDTGFGDSTSVFYCIGDPGCVLHSRVMCDCKRDVPASSSVLCEIYELDMIITLFRFCDICCQMMRKSIHSTLIKMIYCCADLIILSVLFLTIDSPLYTTCNYNLCREI